MILRKRVPSLAGLVSYLTFSPGTDVPGYELSPLRG
jgi:hypothetical protein